MRETNLETGYQQLTYQQSFEEQSNQLNRNSKHQASGIMHFLKIYSHEQYQHVKLILFRTLYTSFMNKNFFPGHILSTMVSSSLRCFLLGVLKVLKSLIAMPYLYLDNTRIKQLVDLESLYIWIHLQARILRRIVY